MHAKQAVCKVNPSRECLGEAFPIDTTLMRLELTKNLIIMTTDLEVVDIQRQRRPFISRSGSWPFRQY